MTTAEILVNAKKAKAEVALLPTEKKNAALLFMAEELENSVGKILKANADDVAAARGKISDVMIDRLALTESRVRAMAEGLREVAKLADPAGEVLDSFTRPNGMTVKKVAVPFGVIAVIYESRPNVTSDAAALCLKSGNACVLRTGKDAHGSAAAIVAAMREGLKRADITQFAINLIDDVSRDSANELMTATGFVDLLIPRGGKNLIQACVDNAKVPCIETGTGICHVFVDESADFKKALDIIENAKCSRPSVCNAMEVCLVHENIAEKFLPLLWQKLVSERERNGVELRLDGKAYKILGGRKNCVAAGEEDFDREFLDYIMAVGVVSDEEEAIEHIAAHSTHHSDCIVTENCRNAEKFVKSVDSAAVYVNVSTRFTDGGEFGLGCEMGISTQKLHARGPMGLRELTTYKYIISGDGQIR